MSAAQFQFQPTIPKFFWRVLLVLFLLLAMQNLWSAGETAGPPANWKPGTALQCAHAHNDYLHARPLFDALASGFTSVEADVHQIGQQLYLGHWTAKVSPQNTLEKVYLEPLQQLIQQQAGAVIPDYDGTFYLMIDIKTDSLATYNLLCQQLSRYPTLLKHPRIKIFVSGNRATDFIAHDSLHVVGVDGRLSDLPKRYSPVVMPVISDNFRRFFRWRGQGQMPNEEFERLRQWAEETHRQGKKLRFWAIPNRPIVWSTLLEAGVDFINTDDLEGLQEFFALRVH